MPDRYVQNPNLIQNSTEEGVELLLPYTGRRIVANSSLQVILEFFAQPTEISSGLLEVVSPNLIDELIINSLVINHSVDPTSRGLLTSPEETRTSDGGWISLPSSIQTPILVGAPFSNDVHAWLSPSRGPEEVLRFLDRPEDPICAYLGEVLRCPDEGSQVFYSRLEELTNLLFRRERLPIIIGGDHSISLSVAKSARSAFKNVFFVSIDAHLDDAPITSPEGIVAPVTNANVVSYVKAELGEKNVAVVGARSGLSLDLEANCLEKLRAKICEIAKRSKGQKVYVSVDVDVLDPSFAPDVNYPRPSGISPRELAAMLSQLLSSCDVIAFDFVETCASGNRVNKTAQCVASLISSLSIQINGALNEK